MSDTGKPRFKRTDVNATKRGDNVNSEAKSISSASDDAADHPLFRRDPNIMHGRLCFRGTRILVATAHHYHDAGYTHEQIMSDYPDLTREQIDAAIASPREDEDEDA